MAAFTAEEERLFDSLFAGEGWACALCALIDRVGDGPLDVSDDAELELLRLRPDELALAGLGLVGTSILSPAVPARLESFYARKDRARAEFHRRLQATLDARLRALLAGPAPSFGSLDLAGALARLRSFHLAHLLPAAPLLSGLRAAMRQQLGDSERLVLWVVDDAALLNLGLDGVEAAVRLLRALGLWLAPPSALLESGGLQRTERCWALLCGAWTRSQLRSIVSAVRVLYSVAPTGRLVSSAVGAGEAAVLRRDHIPFRDWCEVL